MSPASGFRTLIARRLAVTFAVAGGLALSACTGGASAAPIGLSGQVLDASTSLPLGGVKVSVGAQEFITAADGKYSLSALPKGGTIVFENCAFSTFSLPVPTQTGTQNVQLQALPVSGTVTSNLTHKEIAAHFEGKATGDSDKTGKVSLSGLCPGDQITISAKGYADATVQVDESRTLKLSLQADPTTTLKQEVAWDASQNVAKECNLMHPDVRKYYSKAQCIKDYKESTANGYQNISVRVKSVTYIRWTYPKTSGCPLSGKIYTHTAAINYVLQQTRPSGGVSPISGIQHMVQTKDGLWRWFPAVGRCP